MLGLIWAQAHERAIGRNGTMPWHLPEDMAFFKAATMGHPVIMGRRTWESLGKNQPLPGRQNVVITRNPRFYADGALLAPSLEDAYSMAQLARKAATGEADPLVWVMGGASVYAAALPHADGAAITEIDADVEDADAYAPALPANWETVRQGPWHTSNSGVKFRMGVYQASGADFHPCLPEL